MRKSLFIRLAVPYRVLALALVVLAAAPVQAQRRDDASRLKQARAASLSDAGGRTGLTLNKLFSPEHFQMAHSVEFSSSSWGGGGFSMGSYTNSMLWSFDKLDARVDVSVATPFGSGLGFQQGTPQVYLRNAEVSYRPFASTELRLSIQQSPYGGYASPYGYGVPNNPSGTDVRRPR